MLSLPRHIWADVQWRKREEDPGEIRDPAGQELRALLAACIQLIWGNQSQAGPTEWEMAKIGRST